MQITVIHEGQPILVEIPDEELAKGTVSFKCGETVIVYPGTGPQYAALMESLYGTRASWEDVGHQSRIRLDLSDLENEHRLFEIKVFAGAAATAASQVDEEKVTADNAAAWGLRLPPESL